MTAGNFRKVGLAPLMGLLVLAACSPDASVGLDEGSPALARAGFDEPGMHRQYGTPIRLGNGRARTYVVLDAREGNAPVEIGVALDERALEGLPTSGMPVMLRLDMPQRAPDTYKFAMVDWNPHGHDPMGVYDIPHFDFHFYMTSRGEVDAIDPSAADFAAKADNLPDPAFWPAQYVVLAAPGDPPSTVAVPGMGVHWSDVTSPELQEILGNPAGHQPFTRTFIYGSWNGKFTFLEPMITRAHLLTKPDEVIAIPQPSAFQESGWYPDGYRISYDAQAKEYRVALTGLSWFD